MIKNAVSVIEIWSLDIVCNLVLGIWDFAMKGAFLFSILSVAGFAVLWLVLDRVGIERVGEVFEIFSWGYLVPILALTIASVLLSAWRWRRILRLYGVLLPFHFEVGAYLAGFAVSYLTPISTLGGEPLRAILLQEKAGVPLRKGASSVVIDKIAETTIWLVFIAVGAVAALWFGGLPDITKTVGAGIAAFGILAVLVGLVYLLAFQRARIAHKFLRLFKWNNSPGGDLVEGIEEDVVHFFHLGNRVLWETLLLSVLKFGAEVLRIVCIVAAVGKGMQGGASLVSFTVLSFSYFFPLPASLGVQEGGQAVAFDWMGMTGEVGMALSLVVRSMDTLVMALGGIFLVRWGADILAFRIGKALFGKDHKA